MLIVPKLSIVVPVYNMAKYLRVCLDSLRKQTFVDWECVCVDDGSTDESGAILDEYASRDARFRVIHQKNAGVSASRQRGLEMARGEWIAAVDGDDWVEKDFLRDMLKGTESTEVDMVWTDYTEHFGEKVILQRQECGENPIAVLREMIDGRLLGAMWNRILSRKFIQEHELRFFDGRISAFEDFMFLCGVLSRNPRVAYVRVSNYHYVHRVGSAVFYPVVKDVETQLLKTDLPVQYHLEKLLAGVGVEDCLFRRRVRYKLSWMTNSAVSKDFFYATFPDVKSGRGCPMKSRERMFLFLARCGLRDFVLELHILFRCVRKVLKSWLRK